MAEKRQWHRPRWCGESGMKDSSPSPHLESLPCYCPPLHHGLPHTLITALLPEHGFTYACHSDSATSSLQIRKEAMSSSTLSSGLGQDWQATWSQLLHSTRHTAGLASTVSLSSSSSAFHTDGHGHSTHMLASALFYTHNYKHSLSFPEL